MSDIFDKCGDDERISFAKAHGIYPFFHQLESKQDAVVQMNGKTIIMLGSNNYLSLTNNDRVIQAGIESLQSFGSGVSGSRFLNGTTKLHTKLEEEIAKFLNKESCIVFSSGFNANLGFLSCIGSRSDVILCDRENHASIYDGIRLGIARLERYYHNDMQDLEARLKALREDKNVKGILIVTDGVFSMSGELCNLSEIVKLAKKYEARIMVDDAHGLGTIGANGRGTAEHFNLEKETDIIMGTFSKSLASLGGYIAGPKNVLDYIRHASRPFIFSAALPPSNLACAQEALNIIKQEPQRVEHLQELSSYLRQQLLKNNLPIGGIDKVPIIPIYTKGILRTLVICRILFDRGVYVNSVLPPAAPDNECLIRLSLQANHTHKHIDDAVAIINEVVKVVPQEDEAALAYLKTLG